MRTKLLSAAAALVAIAAVAPASAATFAVNDTAGNAAQGGNFSSTPGPDGTFNGMFGVQNIGLGNFSEIFTFTLPTDGLGSGSVTSIASGKLMSTTDLNFTSVFFNGTAATMFPNGRFEFASLELIPITAGQLNTLTVNGFSYGGASIGGSLSFTPTSAVPEAATWAMMLVGFGMMGAGLRYRRRSSTVAFA
ncbi:FxDxF family PEP-CTERM protein [Sphingomonas sp. PAMC 26617]|uniref:FxDxF family PEP-CTERM protein n=1 Tax=Sphingomonas sp. PAMC 26617 TaxID=1112216 RepID=UPI000289509D|nr:FxDxF family PEP-CTERM protein [Sphingomonas sp. PAMC 26617]